jgi:hypothetical protein
MRRSQSSRGEKGDGLGIRVMEEEGLASLKMKAFREAGE